ncbi:MAG TPA: caspase family protein [Acidimicrobiales bacterium]|nr:caspase family protein [Acidimicrobiales bacterium]
MTTRTYRALIVANSTFPSDPHNLPELEGPRNDPALLRDALCDRTAGLVPADNVRLVTERTMSEVLREVEDFLHSASRQDTLILYYSGHGVLDQSNELFLCTRDTRSDRLRSTAVKASDVGEMIDASSAATTVILLDCCHSGRFKGGDVPATLAGRGRFVVTSSRSGELANDTDTRNHASLFTHHLVRGILDGAEDRDGDGVVNLSDLYEYVHAALTDQGRQVPQKRFEGDGDVPIALRTSTTVAHPQPELLDPALVAPVLDVPETTIDLGEIDSDEVLPPERIAVVNRGGGELEWTVESSASWVEPVAHERDVVLQLRPVPGPNRANVYIRDTRTGVIKTVRVSVRMRSPVAAPATPPIRPSTVVVGTLVAAPVGEPPVAEPPAAEPPVPEPPAATAAAPVAEPPVPEPPVAEPPAATAAAPVGEPAVADRVAPGPAPEPVERAAPVVERETAVGEAEPATVPRQAVAASAVEVPPADDAPPPPETYLGAQPAPRPRGRGVRELLRTWLPLVIAALLVIVGILLAASGVQAADAIEKAGGPWPMLRAYEITAMLIAVLGGVVMIVAGLATLVRPLRGMALGVAMTIAAPTGFARLADHEAITNACECVGPDDGVFAFAGMGGWSVLLAFLCAGALGLRCEWTRRLWLPWSLLGVGVAAALLWGWRSNTDLYSYYDDPFGSYMGLGNSSLRILALIAVVAGIVAAGFLVPLVGRAALVGAVAIPVFSALMELIYVPTVATDAGYHVVGVWPFFLSAAVMIAVAVAAWRRASKLPTGECAPNLTG